MQSNISQKTSEQKTCSESAFCKKCLWFLCGTLWGAVLMFIAGVIFLRHSLFLEIPIKSDFPQVVQNLEPAAEKFNWQVSGNSCGIPRMIGGQPLEIFRLCKREYAVELLLEEQDRKIGCLLPCAVSVYKKADGITYLSRLNMPLITNLLGGTSVSIFRDKISPEQKIIFSVFEPLNEPVQDE